MYPSEFKAGAPYSAEEVNESVQTLADGTHITMKAAPKKVYRDSFGRTREERPLFYVVKNTEAAEWPQLVEIMDPVAQVKYTLDVSEKVAHRQQMPVEVQPRRTPAASGVAPIAKKKPVQTTEEPQPKTNREDLGTATVEGVTAEGWRDTTIYPIGCVDNDRPITAVTEYWTSKDLGTVLRKRTDPRMGDTIYRLTNISLTEPPASLFQVPGDYTVVDEAGAFSIAH
jgi:hypothetical protein